MPQIASTSLRDPSTPAVVRLVDTTGGDGPASPREVVAHLQAGAFFWLDLEDPGGDELAEFSQSLQIPADTIVSLVQPGVRSSFAPAADSVQAMPRGWQPPGGQQVAQEVAASVTLAA